MTTILENIIAHKREEISALKKEVSLSAIRKKVEALLQEKQTNRKRPFAKKLSEIVQKKQQAIIAEIKKASPSKGLIRADFNVSEIAHSYELGGAACLSVLTDKHFFQGDGQYLEIARKSASLPALRKDFIVDPYQIYQSYLLGADCILLIVAALDPEKLKDLHELAMSLNLDVLIETHTMQEAEFAFNLDTPLIGVNNRDLHTFKVDFSTSVEIAKNLIGFGNKKVLIAESGINSPSDMTLLNKHGIFCFLIGETFMRKPMPGNELKAWLKQTS